ncbi:putative membrane protein [Bacteroides fragilis str. S13 L11]|nr:putative membrane protein [Bacteroides fragilis str. S13 L11]
MRRQDLASARIVMASRIIATLTKTLVTQFYHYIFPHFTFL